MMSKPPSHLRQSLIGREIAPKGGAEEASQGRRSSLSCDLRILDSATKEGQGHLLCAARSEDKGDNTGQSAPFLGYLICFIQTVNLAGIDLAGNLVCLLWRPG